MFSLLNLFFFMMLPVLAVLTISFVVGIIENSARLVKKVNEQTIP